MTGRHYDLDVLADLAENLLDDETTKAVRGHLAGCALCAAHQAELNDVTRVLASAPQPVLPESLVARLDAALLAEATRGAPAEIVDLASRRRAKTARMARFVSVAAAAVVVSGVGAFAVSNGALDKAGNNDIATVVTPPVPLRTADSMVASGRNYSAEDLRSLAGNQSRIRGDVPPPLTDDQKACVDRTVPQNRSISFIDVAEYQGTRAMIIIATGAVYVAGPNCELLAQSEAG
ncbi:hypothetical protein EDD29_8461 [Actinocorallia herbida]|uniref:Uncharacterized protein n=1 Tax=Actinocorallia herbida TaxID=58109 RepID=A0A3N1DB16_9ACTN|nr:hypothetical protein [Actinocorallia herbida]ROO90723.1 hypothetical protein EDD29_8461 [Actinocorallia herbida]